MTPAIRSTSRSVKHLNEKIRQCIDGGNTDTLAERNSGSRS